MTKFTLEFKIYLNQDIDISTWI